jgi:hypothetical protein
MPLRGRRSHLTLIDRATLPITAHKPQPAKTPRIVFNLELAQGSPEGHSAGRGQCAERWQQLYEKQQHTTIIDNRRYIY